MSDGDKRKVRTAVGCMADVVVAFAESYGFKFSYTLDDAPECETCKDKGTIYKPHHCTFDVPCPDCQKPDGVYVSPGDKVVRDHSLQQHIVSSDMSGSDDYGDGDLYLWTKHGNNHYAIFPDWCKFYTHNGHPVLGYVKETSNE